MTNPVVTYAEYLAREKSSEVRHEYLRGDVWAMAGGSPRRTSVEKTWVLSIFDAGEVVRLESLGVEFELDAVYADPRAQ